MWVAMSNCVKPHVHVNSQKSLEAASQESTAWPAGTLPCSRRAEGAGGRAGVIYCTLITAKLVHQQLKVAPPLPPLLWQPPCSLC